MITSKLSLRILVLILMCWRLASSAAADDQDAAASTAARDILRSIQGRQYEKLWNTQTSDWYRQKTTKDSFMAGITIGRQQLGPAVDSKFLDMQHSRIDPTTGYQGEIYRFSYLNTYGAGKFYEQIVVIKESDGKFRMSGLWWAPAPE